MPQKSSFLASKEEGYIPIASFFKIQFHISICLTVSFLAAIKKVRLLHLHPLVHLPRLDNGECHLHVLKIENTNTNTNIHTNANMQTNTNTKDRTLLYNRKCASNTIIHTTRKSQTKY